MEPWTYRRGLMSVWRSAPATVAFGWLLPLGTLIAAHVVVALFMPQHRLDAPYASHFALVSHALLLLPTLHSPSSAASLAQELRRPWLVLLAVAGVIALRWLLGMAGLEDMQYEVFAGMTEAAVQTPVRFALVMLVVAPLAEELFFRGWLWERLREHWPAPVVAVVTCALFIWAHGDIALAVLPGAVAVTAARLWCGGLRASLLLHVVLNLLAAQPLLT
jgi:membrane protease YdiL (CAAX protease family)